MIDKGALETAWQWDRRPFFALRQLSLGVCGLCIAVPSLGTLIAWPFTIGLGVVGGTTASLLFAHPLQAEGNPLEPLSWLLFGGHTLAFVLLYLLACCP